MQWNRKQTSEIKNKDLDDQNQMLVHNEKLVRLLEGFQSRSTVYLCQYLCSSGEVINNV